MSRRLNPCLLLVPNLSSKIQVDFPFHATFFLCGRRRLGNLTLAAGLFPTAANLQALAAGIYSHAISNTMISVPSSWNVIALPLSRVASNQTRVLCISPNKLFIRGEFLFKNVFQVQQACQPAVLQTGFLPSTLANLMLLPFFRPPPPFQRGWLKAFATEEQPTVCFSFPTCWGWAGVGSRARCCRAACWQLKLEERPC